MGQTDFAVAVYATRGETLVAVHCVNAHLADLQRIAGFCNLSQVPCKCQSQVLHSLQRATTAPHRRIQMTANTTIRFTALFTALLVTAALHGSMLFKFNQVATQGAHPTPTLVTLQNVTIVGKRV
jgi:hypothetical protein